MVPKLALMGDYIVGQGSAGFLLSVGLFYSPILLEAGHPKSVTQFTLEK